MQYKLILVIKLLAFSTLNIYAQKPIMLNEAIELALKNNHQVRSKDLAFQYQKALVNSAYSIPMTNFSTQLGQFNSIYFDTGFGIDQSFSLPKVYKYKKELYKNNVVNFEYLKKMTEHELRKNLEYIFLQHGYLQEKLNLLKKQNDVYQLVVEKATVRQSAGESNILEKSFALQQSLKIEQQISLIDKELELVQLELNLMINDSVRYEPLTSTWSILPYLVTVDNNSVENHPILKQAQQEVEVAKWSVKAQKTALLPEFSLGYNNLGIRGIGSDDVFYNASHRFHVVQVGVNIPIFQKGIKSAINASEVVKMEKQWNYEAQKAQLTTEKDQKLLMYKAYNLIIDQYRNEVLPNLALVKATAEKQYQNGEINYLDLVLLNNQNFTIEADYLETTRTLNAIIIDLFYLTNQF